MCWRLPWYPLLPHHKKKKIVAIYPCRIGAHQKRAWIVGFGRPHAILHHYCFSLFCVNYPCASQVSQDKHPDTKQRARFYFLQKTTQPTCACDCLEGRPVETTSITGVHLAKIACSQQTLDGLTFNGWIQQTGSHIGANQENREVVGRWQNIHGVRVVILWRLME